LHLAAEHRAPGRGVVGGASLGQSERSVRVQGFAGGGLTRRITLVEQGRDLRLIVVTLLDLLLLRRLRSLHGRFWRRRLLLFLLDRFRDRIDRRLRLLLLRLRLFLRLLDDLGRIGLLLDRLLFGLGLWWRRGFRNDRRLLVLDLADGIVHRLCLGDLFD